MALNIAVCMKVVPNPDQYDRIQLDPATKTLIRAGVDLVINSADLHAIELALQLKAQYGGKITLISMGPNSIESQLREGLPHITDVSALEAEIETSARVKKTVGGAAYEYRVALPAVFGVTRRLNKVRHPSVMGIFGVKNKPLTTLTAADFDDLDESRLGLKGSPTQPGGYRTVAHSRTCKELNSVAGLLKVINMARG